MLGPRSIRFHTHQTMARWLIGIDDTDNLQSRGTGYRARCLLETLEAAGLASGIGITRHQLLVDDRVPYTSHNSSACLEVEADDAHALRELCVEFLLGDAADGSDVGLCIAPPERAADAVDYALRAKAEVLNQSIARGHARELGVHLEGLTGTEDGVVGAFAAVGLFAQGNDGRYIWRRKLRELKGATVPVAEFREATGISEFAELASEHDYRLVALADDTMLALGDWARPVRIDGRCVLLVEQQPAPYPTQPHGAHYACPEKSRVKALRP